MRLNETSLAFGYTLDKGGNPNWSTALGQSKSKGYRIDLAKNPGLNSILVAMTYMAIPINKVTTIMGRDKKTYSGNDEDTPIVSAALFTNIYVNNTKIEDGKFILIIDKDHSDNHTGRLRLRYSKHNTYTDNGSVYTNEAFYKKVCKSLGLADNACWCIYDISVENQDTLYMKAKIINKDGPEKYADEAELKAAWKTNPALTIPVSGICTGENIIFYGVPGCGKSYHIENEVLLNLKVKEENKIRTTFYQDYSNTDFVGQILPRVTGEKVEYIFNPGPFTLALIRAYKNPEENVALIVEEINRGNAPAIFGDTFQLLDRKNGVSEYGIKNVQIIDYLNDYNFGKDGEDMYYHFDEIKIPGNLYIYATMNTSDQNVYTLDTAFTRRWDKVKIPNKFVNENDKDYFEKRYVPGTNVLWKTFADAINNHITNNLDNLQVNEDKQLGAFFIKDSALSVEAEVGKRANEDNDNLKSNFAHKVLDYLWNDVSKFEHSIIFKLNTKGDKKINTLDSLIDEFKKNGIRIFQENILKNMTDNITISEEQSSSTEDTDESVELDG